MYVTDGSYIDPYSIACFFFVKDVFIRNVSSCSLFLRHYCTIRIGKVLESTNNIFAPRPATDSSYWDLYWRRKNLNTYRGVQIFWSILAIFVAGDNNADGQFTSSYCIYRRISIFAVAVKLILIPYTDRRAKITALVRLPTILLKNKVKKLYRDPCSVHSHIQQDSKIS